MASRPIFQINTNFFRRNFCINKINKQASAITITSIVEQCCQFSLLSIDNRNIVDDAFKVILGVESCETCVLHRQKRRINFLPKESEGISFGLVTLFECQQKQHGVQEGHNGLL